MSLAEIARAYAHLPVRTIQGTVRQLLSDEPALGQFHLVYAAGLFDYLEDAVAKRLIQRMWAMTVPGGRVKIANFMPDIPDVGYMEDEVWWLFYALIGQGLMKGEGGMMFRTELGEAVLQHLRAS